MSTTLEKPAALIAAIILAMLSCVALPAMSRAAEPSAAPEGVSRSAASAAPSRSGSGADNEL